MDKISKKWLYGLPLVALLVLAAGCATNSDEAEGVSKITVSYVPGDEHLYHQLDLYRPAGAKEPLPLILWIHGGVWSMGSKEPAPTAPFLSDGYALASINYRLSNEGLFPAQLDDSKAAVRFLRAHAAEYGLKVDKIGAFGFSAGGHLVALLGTTSGIKSVEGNLGNLEQSSSVQAVCDWAGPTDLMTVGKQGGPHNQLDLNSPTGPVAELLGGLPKDKKELAQAASPITYVAKDNPPFLIMQGDSDTVVPIQQSEELQKALQKAGVKSEFVVVKHGRHNFMSQESFAKAKEFFDREIR